MKRHSGRKIYPGRPKKCDVVPKRRGGACQKQRDNGGMLCKYCTAWPNAA